MKTGRLDERQMKAMRYRKRLFAMLAAAILILPATVYAENSSVTKQNEGSITLDNPVEGVVYTAYKIFDVSYNTGETTYYSYSIRTDDGWYEYVKAYADQIGSGLILIPAAEDGTCMVTTTSEFRAADFASYLSKNENPQGGVSLTDMGEGDNAVATVSNLPLGYYFVKGNNDSLCNLTTTDPDVVIYDKNDVPFTKTVDDGDGNENTQPEKDGVQVGQVLTFTISGAVPETGGFDTYIYNIRDTMDEGLTFNRDVRASIGGVEVALREVTDPGAVLVGNQIRYSDNGFEMSLDMKNKSFHVPIVLTYTAVVNENAVAQITENSAVLSYGQDADQLTESVPQIVQVFSAEIDIIKYEKKLMGGNDDSIRLADAQFVLSNGNGGNARYYKAVFTGTGEAQVLTKVEWVRSMEDATVITTDENGEASFEGLKNGTYYLIETKAPEGFNLLAAPAEIVIEGDITATDQGSTPTGLTVTARVANSRGFNLPDNGGIGIFIFYGVGIVLMLTASLLAVRMYRTTDGRHKV